MTQATVPSPTRQHSNAYNLFIFVLTILSLVVMVLMILPISDATFDLLQVYDNLICVIFLVDFYFNLRAAPKKSDYFIGERGWLDLLGSIPSFGGAFKFAGLLRLARLSRLARISRLMRGQNRKEIVDDIINNRSAYATYITILLALTVLTASSVLVLQFESKSPDAKILTGGDSLWYAIVTLTTVGYGDYYPVTSAGRVTAVFVMFAGVGIIGALASILASVLVGSPPEPAEDEADPAALPIVVGPSPAMEQELAAIRAELAQMHQMLTQLTSNTTQSSSD